MQKPKQLSLEANDLCRELFRVAGRLKNLVVSAHNSIDVDDASEFDEAVCKVAEAYESLARTNLVVDCTRDTKDQSYADVTLPTI